MASINFCGKLWAAVLHVSKIGSECVAIHTFQMLATVYRGINTSSKINIDYILNSSGRIKGVHSLKAQF